MTVEPSPWLLRNDQRAAVQFGQFLGDGQAEAEALLILHLPLELHIGADAADLFGGKSAAVIPHGKFNLVARRFQADLHRLAGLGKFKGVLHQFDDDFSEIFLGHRQRHIGQT